MRFSFSEVYSTNPSKKTESLSAAAGKKASFPKHAAEHFYPKSPKSCKVGFLILLDTLKKWKRDD
jgi:hypothetical protein